MARQPRFVALRQPHLIEQSALDGVELFRDKDDFVSFLALLKDSAKVNNVPIHCYSLLPARLNILATPETTDSLSRLMQWIGRRYVPYYNGKYGRTGTLWRARFRASAVDPASHVLMAHRFIEECPVREGLAVAANEYSWSSFNSHAGVAREPMLTPHAAYWALGNTPFEREIAYRLMFEHTLPAADVSSMNRALLGGRPIGPRSFAESLEKQAGRRLTPGLRGRPRRPDPDRTEGITSVPN